MTKPDHLLRFPCLEPFVGESYRNEAHRRILILGESHYQPPSAAAHLDAGEWYQASQDVLSAEELGWISTDRIVREARDTNYRLKSHGIFREVARELHAAGLELTPGDSAINHCAFYNFFQRPAEITGGSIRIQTIDLEVAAETLDWVITHLAPEIVIFVSRKAGQHGGPLLEKHSIPWTVTPHPSSRWWNRRAKRYSGKRGRDLFGDILQSESWVRSR